MKKLILILIFIGLTIHSKSQDKFYIKGDIGLSKALFSSNLDELSGKEFNGITGIYLGYSINKKIDFETGLNYFMISTNYYLQFDDHALFSSTGSSDYKYLITPFNFYYNLIIPNSKFIISPSIGISACFRQDNDVRYESLTFDDFHDLNSLTVSMTDSITDFRIKPDYNKTILINAGLNVDYNISNKIAFTIKVNISKGFNDINKLGVLIKREDDTNLNGILTNNGSHFYSSLGLKFKL